MPVVALSIQTNVACMPILLLTVGMTEAHYSGKGIPRSIGDSR